MVHYIHYCMYYTLTHLNSFRCLFQMERTENIAFDTFCTLSHFIWYKYKMSLHRLRDLRSGELVGTDKAGNKYFQNDNYFFGKIYCQLTVISNARRFYICISEYCKHECYNDLLSTCLIQIYCTEFWHNTYRINL